MGMLIQNWRLAMSRFIIEFGDRLSDHLEYGSNYTELFTGAIPSAFFNCIKKHSLHFFSSM